MLPFKPSSKSFLLTLALVCFAGVLSSAATPGPSQKPLRVALMAFATEGVSWRDELAAADFTAQLQAQMSGEPAVDWVERAQLELAEKELSLTRSGFTSRDQALRAGRWSRADLAVL